jgi:hypothetical protein
MHVIRKLIDTPGILAACGGHAGAFDFAFSDSIPEVDKDRWQGVFGHLRECLEAAPSGHDEIKLVLDHQSIVLRRNGGIYVGVAVEKGHVIVKSMQRMVRAAFKKMGAPLTPKGHSRPVAYTPPATLPSPGGDGDVGSSI